MKIVVVDIAASTGGAMSILKSFYDYVVENNCKDEWLFLLGDQYLKDRENIKIKCFPNVKKSKINRLKFDFWGCKKIVEEFKADLVISLQNTAVWGINVPQIVYVHQAIPFQKEKCFSFFRGSERKYAIYQYIIGFIIKLSVRRANHVVVQTNWMKKSVSSAVGLSENKLSVIMPPFSEIDSEVQNININKSNFFYPTSDAVYKNIDCLVKAKKILDSKGFANISVFITVDKNEARKNLECIGVIHHEEVLSRLKNSTMVFPSYLETVGLPLLEAKSLGTIIIVSDCPYSREVLYGYENAYFFNYKKPQELAELMEKVYKKEIKLKPNKLYKKSKIEGWNKFMKIIDSYRNVK